MILIDDIFRLMVPTVIHPPGSKSRIHKYHDLNMNSKIHKHHGSNSGIH